MGRSVDPLELLELPAMRDRLFEIGRPVVAALALLWPAAAGAAEIMPHHAVYTMSLGRANGDAGVTAASGTMAYQWGESCEGWTVEQRYRLKMGYAESADVSIASNFLTTESHDALRYRFNQKETRSNSEEEEIRGEAKLDGVGVAAGFFLIKAVAQCVVR